MKILFATNSLIYAQVGGPWNVEAQFERMAQEGGQAITVAYSRIGGGTLQNHWDDDFRINARDELANGNYDIFVMNGRSGTEAGFDTNVGRLADLAAANGTASFLLSSWPADAKISLSNPNTEINIEEVTHRTSAQNHDTGYIPLNLAYRDLYLALAVRYNDTQNGEIVEDLLTADNTHGTHLANYLVASMLYASIFGQQPPSSWFPPGVTAADASLVRTIAWSVTQQFAIPIDGGGPPPANAAPVFTSATEFDVAENSTAVGTMTATDADGDTLVFAIAGGVDAGLFQINGTTGVLRFRDAPDFEAPGDAGGNNVYDLNVSVSDGEASVLRALRVTVTDVDEGPGPGPGPGGDYDGYNPITAAGLTRGTAGADVFEFQSVRGDVLAGGAGGLDAYVFSGLSGGIPHRVRDFELGEIVDVSGLVNYTGGDIGAYVRIDASTLSRQVVQVDVNGAAGGANFVNLVVLTGLTSALDAQDMYDDGLLIL